jgi:hypothetical protein
MGLESARRDICKVSGMVVWLSECSADGESFARSARRGGTAVLDESFERSAVWWYGSEGWSARALQGQQCGGTARRVLGESFARSAVWWYGSASARPAARALQGQRGLVVQLSECSARALQGQCGVVVRLRWSARAFQGQRCGGTPHLLPPHPSQRPPLHLKPTRFRGAHHMG